MHATKLNGQWVIIIISSAYGKHDNADYVIDVIAHLKQEVVM